MSSERLYLAAAIFFGLSIFIYASAGVWGIMRNGLAADAAPRESVE